MAGGGKDAVFINRADAALGGPGEAGVLREQGEVVLIGLRGQLDARAGGDAQLGERAAELLAVQDKIVRPLDLRPHAAGALHRIAGRHRAERRERQYLLRRELRAQQR